MKNKKNILIWSAVAVVVIIIILLKIDFNSEGVSSTGTGNPSAR
ncbi:MAG: hypothetical protein ABIG69_04665 [Bacteroidota bacterium]